MLLFGLLVAGVADGCDLVPRHLRGRRASGSAGAAASPSAAAAGERQALLTDPCMSLSPPCFTEEDRFSLEALQTIHKQMDDDKDGGIEVDESDEFIREDMKYKDAPLAAHPRHPHHPQHPQHSLPSPDPDILSVSSCPALYRNEEEEEAIYFTAEKQWEVPDTASECDSLNSSSGRKPSPPSSLEMYQTLSSRKISRDELSLEDSSRGESPVTADVSRCSPECVGLTETKSMIFSPASRVYNGILEKSCSMHQLSSGIPVPHPRHTSCSSAGNDSKPVQEASNVSRVSSIPHDLCHNGEKSKKPSKIKSLFKKKSK